MKYQELQSFYQEKKLKNPDFEQTVSIIKSIELAMNQPLEDFSVKTLDDAISIFYETGKTDVEFFICIMRYMRMIKHHELFIRLTQYTGGIDVIESILERLVTLHGEALKNKIINQLTLPQLGMKPEKIIFFTSAFMTTLHQFFSPEEIKTILTGNNHQIPISSFESDKVLYESSETLEEFLRLKHQNMIEILSKHAKENKVWFEQHITEDVVRYIASDQELLSARLIDDTLMMRKIPYNVEEYLKTKDPLQKRYLSCHCPFAREAILNPKADISPLWCYCSAGFEKLPFETVLNHPLKIRVLKSVLNGDEECRFAISLKDIPYKK